MTQLRFTLYTVNPSNRPLVKWLDNLPLPLSDLKTTATDPGFDPKNPHSHSAGVLTDVWHIHRAGCLVIAESRQLFTGERFAISLEPLLTVAAFCQAQRVMATSRG
jgi:hypothetical protein